MTELKSISRTDIVLEFCKEVQVALLIRYNVI